MSKTAKKCKGCAVLKDIMQHDTENYMSKGVFWFPQELRKRIKAALEVE